MALIFFENGKPNRDASTATAITFHMFNFSIFLKCDGKNLSLYIKHCFDQMLPKMPNVSNVKPQKYIQNDIAKNFLGVFVKINILVPKNLIFRLLYVLSFTGLR